MIDLNMDFIDAFIPSKDTRAYLHSIHYEFNNNEKATIVANHLLVSKEDKIEWLTAFKEIVSNKRLREKIQKAIEYIKENMGKDRRGDYNDALFDFVFIPHDFRHGDIVRSLYGEWDTTVFHEKIGIILNYFDEDYDFYRNMRGDYSDTQVCVDVKFDSDKYLGEFSHEHMNPIYIERLSLHDKDERRVYLDYLINVYAKKSLMKRKGSKPEYVSELTDKLEQRYLDEYIPVYDEDADCWCVQTGHGFEKGNIDYVAAKFSGTGLIYHFVENGKEDHVHGFEAVLERIIANPEGIEIESGYSEYSENELQFAQSVKQAVSFVKTHNRPMTNAELRENRKSAINSVEEIGVLNVDFAYAKWLTTILKTYMKHNINNLSVEFTFEGKRYTIEDAVNEIVSIADEYIDLRNDVSELETEKELISNFKYAGRLFTEVMPYLWL